MSITADYPAFTDARTHLKDILDSNARGTTVTVGRGERLSAVVPLARLRDHLVRSVPARVRVMSEDGRVIALMDGRPFVSEGADIDAALVDLTLTLREYAEDWEDHLQHAPNHAGEWSLVQLIKVSTDDELREWFLRDDE